MAKWRHFSWSERLDVPLGDAEWDEELIKDAGYNPADMSIIVMQLEDDWYGFPCGSPVVGKQLEEGSRLSIRMPEPAKGRK